MKQVAIVGVGLIGGSIGAALRNAKVCDQVVGVGRNLKRLESAQSNGLLDTFSDDLAATATDSDLVLICTPVETIVDFAVTALDASDRVIVTDAGSTKLGITRQLQSRLTGQPQKLSRFIGGHPIAGGERSGFEAAQHDLLHQKLVVVTPTASTDETTTQTVTRFWESLGAKVTVQTPAQHDDVMASVSHLPHLIAAVLAAATPESNLAMAGSGFAGTTRVASGDVELWRQIFSQNKSPVLESIELFESTLAAIKKSIAEDDHETLSAILQKGKLNRDSLGN